MMIDTSNLITIIGGVIACASMWGAFQARMKATEKELDSLKTAIEVLKEHNETVIELKTKIDFIILHFLNEKAK